MVKCSEDWKKLCRGHKSKTKKRNRGSDPANSVRRPKRIRITSKETDRQRIAAIKRENTRLHVERVFSEHSYGRFHDPEPEDDEVVESDREFKRTMRRLFGRRKKKKRKRKKKRRSRCPRLCQGDGSVSSESS